MGAPGTWCLPDRLSPCRHRGEGSKGMKFLRLSAVGPIRRVLCEGGRDVIGIHGLANGGNACQVRAGLFKSNLVAEL